MPITLPFLIAEPLEETSLGVTFDSTNYLVTWSSQQIWGRKYNHIGQPLGPAFRISNSQNPQLNCDAAAGANNRYLNVWAEFRDLAFDIYGNLDIMINDIEESHLSPEPRITLKSLLVRDLIELNGAVGKEIFLFDALGRFIGTTWNGRFHCQNLAEGIYFVKTPERNFKVIKID